MVPGSEGRIDLEQQRLDQRRDIGALTGIHLEDGRGHVQFGQLAHVLVLVLQFMKLLPSGITCK